MKTDSSPQAANTSTLNLPNSTRAFCLRYIKTYGWILFGMLILEAGQAACSILLPYSIQQLIDYVSVSDHNDLNINDIPVLLFIALNLGIVLFSRASGALLVYLGPKMRKQVRLELFAYLQLHSHHYFLSHFAGSLANRISEVSMGVTHVTWTYLFDFWPLIISFSVSLYLLAGVNFELALTLGVWISLYCIISFLLALRCRRLAEQYAETRSQVSGKIVDSVTNIINTNLFARTIHERQYIETYLDKEVKAARKTFWFMEIIRWFQFISAMLLMLGIIGIALDIWLKKQMSVGEFAMSASLSLMLIEQARGLSRRFLELFEYIGNINNGVSRIIKPHEITDSPQASELLITQAIVEFNHIDFSYTSKTPVFQQLNLKILHGEKVGIVGFSGSGKSTLFHLILRFFEPQSGAICIDGQNIGHVTQESLRSNIAMIPQDPMLFHRSLLENIRYGRLDASDEDVMNAAKKAHAHDFISATEDGYQSLVGERGVKLSGGQRQRIALARAILKNSPLLLLDEATSALDSVTERQIQDSLQFLMQEKTVLVIAHRLSTLSHLDRILVFHHGKIIEQGTHKSLLNKEGHYKKMWDMQAGGFLPESDIYS